jgi:DNA mismatch endonuclease (patch repair protein)
VADNVDAATRSRMMAGIRGKNTKPERIIRSGLHRRGFRFRLHGKNLPGTPDLVLPKYNAVIFVHGCFWHGHDCSFFKMPRTRVEFWKAKFARNGVVDRKARNRLLREGWRVLVIWECVLRGRSDAQIGNLLAHVAAWLKSSLHALELREPRIKAG